MEILLSNEEFYMVILMTIVISNFISGIINKIDMFDVIYSTTITFIIIISAMICINFITNLLNLIKNILSYSININIHVSNGYLLNNNNKYRI
jgi:hypothetical protein